MIFHSRKRRGRTLCAVLTVLCACLAAAAEEDPGTYEKTYVVTASRSGKEDMDAGAFVTVITADDIAESGKTGIIEILESIPGVRFASYSGEAEAQISMRGFGENAFGRVLVLADGKRLNNPDMKGINWLSVPLSSIERIEVSDGPASALYGSNASGGVVNIVTKEPGKDFSASARLSGGSFWTTRALFNMSKAWARGGGILSVDSYNTGGWRERSGSRTLNALVSGYIDITDTLTVKPSFGFTDLFYEMPGALTKEEYDKDPRQAKNLDDAGSERHLTGTLAVTWDPGEGISAELPAAYTFKSIGTDVASFSSYSDRTLHSVDIRPNIGYDTFFPAGAYDIGFHAGGGFDFTGAFLDNHSYAEKKRLAETNRFRVSQFQFGPWADLRTDLPFGFSVEAAARYDTAFIKAENKDGAVDDSCFYHAFVYDASLIYRPVRQFSVYAKAGSLFRYPFTDETASLYGYGADSFNKDLKPETGYNVEAGIKTDFGPVFRAKLNAFYMPLTDEIAYNAVTGTNENMQKTVRAGGNVSVSSEPFPFAALNVSFSYIYAVFSAGDNKGKCVPLVPDMTAYAEVMFRLPQNIRLGPNVSFTGRAYQGGDEANTAAIIPPYTLLGALFTYAPPQLGGALTVTVRADNLLGTKYAPLTYYSTWTGNSSFYPAPGRSFSASVSYRY